jgi:NAD(P)-dependent dehydrogenase (short-subunit alcohol dehydrogenase family)
MKPLVLITGTTSGLGLATAKRLAALDMRLVLACRNTALAEQQAADMIEQTNNPNIEVMQIDMSSLESIDTFIKEFQARYDNLDILINNAGVFCDTAMTTVDGYEMTMGVNLVGTYYLTKQLVPSLKGGINPKIITVASKAGFYGKLKIKEGFLKNHAHGFKAYSASKLGQIIMTRHLAEKLHNDNITVNAVHPGEVSTGIWKGDSFLMKIMGPINRKRYASPEDACETSVYLATSESVNHISGKLFQNKSEVMDYNKKILDHELTIKLMSYLDDIFKE